ncbi:Transcriptional regulator of ribosomal biogenesis proteins [Chytriomyces hyalinus]|nr:Transcriptional regulator of ribosomal biogenesis proteins [Chytriomyces hyalinus]
MSTIANRSHKGRGHDPCTPFSNEPSASTPESMTTSTEVPMHKITLARRSPAVSSISLSNLDSSKGIKIAATAHDDSISSYRRTKALLDNLSRSITSNGGNSRSFLASPMLGANASTAALAKSISKSMGKSWSREAFLEVTVGGNTRISEAQISEISELPNPITRFSTLAMHLDPRSPLLAASPQRDLDQFAILEDQFCKDFSCCGIALDSMHDLLQHFEEYHVVVESDCDEDDEYEDDDEYEQFPFEIDDSMDMDEFDIVSAQQHQEFNTAFLRAQIASMTTPVQAAHGANLPMTSSDGGSVFQQQQQPRFQQKPQEEQQVTRATISSLLGNTPRTPANMPSFSQIQKHDDQVDVFRIMPPQRSQSEFSPVIPHSVFAAPPRAPSAFNDTVIRKRTSTFTTPIASGNGNISNYPTISTPTNASRRRRQNPSSFDTPPALLPFCTDGPTPTRVYAYDEDMCDDEDETMADSTPMLPTGNPAALLFFNNGNANSFGSEYEENELDEVAAVVAAANVAREETAVTKLSHELANLNEPLVTEVIGGSAGNSSNSDDRPFKCKLPGCGKEYKNPNGLKYHMRHGHGVDTGNPELDNMINKPYQCVIEQCAKRYKNLNGLKYHMQHAHVELLESRVNMEI